MTKKHMKRSMARVGVRTAFAKTPVAKPIAERIHGRLGLRFPGEAVHVPSARQLPFNVSEKMTAALVEDRTGTRAATLHPNPVTNKGRATSLMS